MPGMVRSASLDIAIIAPVLPPDRAASATCSFTALIAMPIEVVRARRIAWLGFSLAAIASGEWTMSAGRLEVAVALDLGRGPGARRRRMQSAASGPRAGRAKRRRSSPRDRRRRPWRRSRCVGPGSWPGSFLSLGRGDFAALIMAACRAQIVWQLAARRNWGIPGTGSASAHDGCDACSASRARFFFWGQPLRHLQTQ